MHIPRIRTTIQCYTNDCTCKCFSCICIHFYNFQLCHFFICKCNDCWFFGMCNFYIFVVVFIQNITNGRYFFCNRYRACKIWNDNLTSFICYIMSNHLSINRYCKYCTCQAFCCAFFYFQDLNSGSWFIRYIRYIASISV